MDFQVGERTWRRKNGESWTHSLDLDHEVDTIPLGVLTFNLGTFTASYSILCELSATGLSIWQTKVHAAIMEAYKTQLLDYERKLEEYATTILPMLFGRPPEENRRNT